MLLQLLLLQFCMLSPLLLAVIGNASDEKVEHPRHLVEHRFLLLLLHLLLGRWPQ